MERLHVAGLPTIRADVDVARSLLWEDCTAHRPNVYVLVNGYSARLRRQARYAAVLEDTQVVPLPDGIPMTLGARLTCQGDVFRCPGADLMEAAAALAAADGMRFFLLGGGPGTAEALRATLEQRHPGLNVAGVMTPPFGDWSDEASREMVAAIARSSCDVVWVGVSAPKQETWACRWIAEIGRPIVCVGAAFDFLSGGKRRAPSWMRRFGLEWLFRLLSEPRRLGSRYLVGNAVFVGDLVRYWNRAPSCARDEDSSQEHTLKGAVARAGRSDTPRRENGV